VPDEVRSVSERLRDIERVEVEVDPVLTRRTLAEPAPVDELDGVSIGRVRSGSNGSEP